MARRVLERRTNLSCIDVVRSTVIVALLLGTVACTRADAPVRVAPSISEGKPSTSSTPCPVTIPDGSHRPGDPAGLGEQGYGNGKLWVGLWPKGRARATKDNVNPHGAIVMKFPWDRGVKGKLEITGRRLDAEAPRMRAHLSDYGLTGFQPSSLVFPTEGCWEVTGSVGETSLTFVTKVTLAR